MKYGAAVGLACTIALALAVPAAQGTAPAALLAMAEAERAFARAATVKGVRDAFLEFFSDDALAFTPLPGPAKERLRQQPARPFSAHGIVWEPRAGDVASSEEIGWLTGPATFLKEGATQGHGCYLSVWRKGADGRWLVFIDIGVDTPEPVPFAPGFRRVSVTTSYTGTESAAAATRSLTEADRRLNDDVRTAGARDAYAQRLIGASRLHRNGMVPLIGNESIGSWLGAHAKGLTAATGAAEASRAGDLGYSYGTYQLPGPAGESGPYVRIWSRDGTGRWLLMADVAHPIPPRR